MDYLKGLNPQQQQAVLAASGPVLVMAGPGSGKTRVLTQRVAYLIGALGVPPYAILAVTFTNKAAREMETRLLRLLGEKAARGLTLGTFHATCARILRREARHLPFDANFVIYDTDDQLSLLRQVLEDLNLDEKRYRPQAVHALISYAKNELLLPDNFPVHDYRDEVVARIYRRYQELLLASNALDFDDLLLYTVYLMEQVPEAKQRYARLFEHILVDEFQDTNPAQYVLVRHLSSYHRNLFVVGDIDQSIYRWRGADYRNVLRFEQDFPDAQVILLEQNYRSTQAILDVAMAVIEPHPYRTAKQLFTERGRGQAVRLIEVRDDVHEAQWVVDTIAELIRNKQVAPGEIAIMYRTNAQSRLLEEAFLQRGLRYRLVGAQRFYGRREIKDLIAYLRVIHNPADEVSLLRILNTPPRGIGNKTVLALRAYAQQLKLSSGDALLAIAAEPQHAVSEVFPQRAVVAVARFGELLANWRAQMEHLTPLQLLDSVMSEIDYRTYLDDGSQEGQERWENVMELRRLAAEFEQSGLAAFLERVALVSDQDTLAEGNDAPTLLTLHAAKGLEFGVVFIVGLNEGSLPHARSLDDPEALHEERRLFYVGITRAKDRLFLVYSQTRRAYGYAEPQAPSRFLEDIPSHLLELQSLSPEQSWFAKRGAKDAYEKAFAPASAPILEKRFSPGNRVRHPIWGEGMVLNSALKDSDEVVDVFFESVGLKRVSVSIGKLERIS
ncbi:MAG: DNA helicase UvrD [Anaerolineae bacterium]|jgi:DNA helicase-2/ATP-dependent DNA helicase PcrA|nr:MAG: DNA helicase UvrD [Anaerolineae bacterium]